MRNELQEITTAANACKSAGVHIASKIAGLIGELEREGYLEMLPASDDEALIECLVETIAQSKHFEKKHSTSIEAYSLFTAAAKAEALDARTPAGKLAMRAMDDAEQSYIDSQWDEEAVRVGDLESAS